MQVAGECAKITCGFEAHVARGLWADARKSYNAPSQRNKKRPKYVDIFILFSSTQDRQSNTNLPTNKKCH
jgi:hypothetical protein